MGLKPAGTALSSHTGIALAPGGWRSFLFIVKFHVSMRGGCGTMRRKNILLFLLILVIALAWGIYYWLFLV
ncbi:hypothetical protein [Caldibacillus debilis]|jgi:hypothetical protein|uniref:Uncharacterized protein n=1 Tax=Caldibacillus debilis TaxID=301148 RepID=A0A150M6G3_9BACI|nr:hypothetical protein [Caldibacillus debilis]KYD20200.1 hypothetical protein B4135_1976 [Caldibacillus debilis]